MINQNILSYEHKANIHSSLLFIIIQQSIIFAKYAYVYVSISVCVCISASVCICVCACTYIFVGGHVCTYRDVSV